MEARLGPKRVSQATGKIEAPTPMQVTLSSGDAWRGMRLDQVTLAPSEEPCWSPPQPDKPKTIMMLAKNRYTCVRPRIFMIFLC